MVILFIFKIILLFKRTLHEDYNLINNYDNNLLVNILKIPMFLETQKVFLLMEDPQIWHILLCL